MSEWVRHLLESMGYGGIALLMFLENVFPPIPSELVMPLAGYSAGRGDLSLAGVIAAGTAGSLLGALPWYFAGRYVGTERLKRWADRRGKWLTVSGKDVDKASEWFGKHGSKTVLIGRLVPGVRTLISVPAGMHRMGPVRFLLLSALGAAGWNGVLAVLGYQLGERYEIVDRYMGPATAVLLGLMALGLAFTVYRRRSGSKAGGGTPAGAADTPPK